MLNEYTYCPRLCYMEWVQGEFAHSADTLDGRFQHRRVDRPAGDLPAPNDEDAQPEKIHARSVMLSDEGLGAIARIDLVETDGARATPVDYKRGTVPDIPGHVYDPERVQLCLQGLLLRANGYQCEQGVIYYVRSKRRVYVGFDNTLVKQTLEMLEAARKMADSGEIPPPLEDSPKCPRCSLVGICLPDEVSFLKGSRYVVRPDDVRRLMPARDDALPMYVASQGGIVGKSGDTLTVKVKGKIAAKARLLDVSSVSIFGNAQVTAQATRVLLERGIPICHFTYGGWLKGVTWGMAHKNVELRTHQFRVARDQPASLAIAKEMVTASLGRGRIDHHQARVAGDSQRDGDGQVAQQPGDAAPQPPAAAGNSAGGDKAPDQHGGAGRFLWNAAWRRRSGCPGLFRPFRRYDQSRNIRLRLPDAQPPAAQRSGQCSAFLPVRNVDEAGHGVGADSWF